MNVRQIQLDLLRAIDGASSAARELMDISPDRDVLRGQIEYARMNLVHALELLTYAEEAHS